MWRNIEEACSNLSDHEINELVAGIPEQRSITFQGFDAGEEPEFLFIALFMIEKLELFREFDYRDINSRTPTIDDYRAMHKAFDTISSQRKRSHLTLKEVTGILNA
ncbi:hypothetical protein TKWG_23355 [Advenella kashmirensis WT001]|uniref:Uncharacterized protein n=2 Tax=Advenella kashmirensis TaxID=310575 RepID=I3UGY0_ADVKW|nr:hypothetical protein TKWG_23355 [Advenella kashmirensis WT001]